jgi:hypothetical protein
MRVISQPHPAVLEERLDSRDDDQAARRLVLQRQVVSRPEASGQWVN